MTDRSMNYDLDGIFASRNQGQLISSEPTYRNTVRTPGLTPMRRDGVSGYVDAPSYSGTHGDALAGSFLDDASDNMLANNWMASAN